MPRKPATVDDQARPGRGTRREDQGATGRMVNDRMVAQNGVAGTGSKPPTTAAAPLGWQKKTPDIHILVRTPAKISREQIFATDPYLYAKSGVAFRLARRGKLKHDENTVGILRWKAAGSKVAEGRQEEETDTFRHSWKSDTRAQDVEGKEQGPFELNDIDVHVYGLLVDPGRLCVEKAKRHKPPFDPLTNDWTFEENAKFSVTVTFSDREIKRAYYYVYRCRKEGSRAEASVEYSGVDEVVKT